MDIKNNYIIRRTQNDTDPICTTLIVVDNSGKSFVSDDSITELHIATHPAISITGIPKGNDSGIFCFPTIDLTGLIGTYPFEIEVNDLTSIYTIGKGRIIFTSEIL